MKAKGFVEAVSDEVLEKTLANPVKGLENTLGCVKEGVGLGPKAEVVCPKALFV